MAAVLAGGARSAEICILESDSSAAPRLEASYVFDSREALQVSTYSGLNVLLLSLYSKFKFCLFVHYLI